MGSIAASGDGGTVAFAEARAARVAITAAGAHTDLDTALRCAAKVLRARFGADHASYLVHHWEHQPHAIGVDSTGMDDPWLRRWAAHPDRQFRSQVAAETMPLIVDLRAIVRSPSQEESLALGIRSSMQLALRDEQGEMLGLVMLAALRPGAFVPEQLEEFRELAGLSAGFVRRALLQEQVDLKRALMEEEAALLSALTRSETGGYLPQAIARGIQQAIGADLVVIFSRALDTPELAPVFSFAPEDALTDDDWTSLEAAIGKPGSEHVIRPTGECYGNADLGGSAPSPVEAWLRDTLGHHSLLVASGRVTEKQRFAIAATRRDAGPWNSSIVAFLSGVAGLLELHLGRDSTRLLATHQAQRTEGALNILSALGSRDTLEQIGQALAEAVRAMYGAELCEVAVFHDDQLTVAGMDAVASDQISARVDPVEGMLSTLRVPIGNEAAPLGFVTVASARVGAFTESDAKQLTQIAQPLGVIVNYFDGRREAEQRTLRLEYTNRILTRLSAGGTAEHLAAGFLAECRVLFECEHAVVVHFDHERSLARLLAMNSTVIDAASLPATIDLNDLNSARFIRQPTPHVIADTRIAPEGGAYHAELSEAGLHSTIRAPLMVQDTVHGTVALWTRGASAYRAEDAELLGTLARPLAIALEKAAALESLAESELKYRSLVAQAEEMIFQFDSETRVILDANAYTAVTLGYSAPELLTLRLDDVIEETSDDIADDVARTVESGELHLLDKRFRRRDGSLFEVDMVDSLITYGGRRAVLVLARDVSERKAFQRQLMQGQKMESLGTMAGHVAHDFNNLLTTILGFAGLLKRSSGMDAEQRENLGLIEDAARRAADLTGHLLSFARGGLVRFGPIDLRHVVNDTMRLAAPSFNDSLHASARLPATPVMVEGDAGQLHQALFNIVSNARDAMPEGGTIDVDLSTDGVTAIISIADNGPGMDEETKMRIFEPFFTTKPLGTGTGLGMAITYGIIQGHHGDVALQSARGKGTTFTITLPLLPSGIFGATGDAFNAGEGNLVLVVDDDEMVRRTTSATLAELGYNVVEAPGGATAVEIVRARPDRFSVVLLDLVMPGMTGSETFRALTAIRADLPVVVCTGYAADSHIDMDVKRRIAGLVQKPFTGERLGKALVAAGAHPTRKPVQ